MKWLLSLIPRKTKTKCKQDWAKNIRNGLEIDHNFYNNTSEILTCLLLFKWRKTRHHPQKKEKHLRPHLHCQLNVTQFRFLAYMWLRSDVFYDSVIRKKTYIRIWDGFQASIRYPTDNSSSTSLNKLKWRMTSTQMDNNHTKEGVSNATNYYYY